MMTDALVYSVHEDLSAIAKPPILADSRIHNPQVVGNLQRGEHPFGGLCGVVAVTLRDKVMTLAIDLGKQDHIEAPLKGEILIYHLANGLRLYLARVRVGFRVMQKVHDDIIGEQKVDIVDKIAEINRHVRELLIADFLGAVKHGVDHKELRVINDIPLQLGVFEHRIDVLVGCAGLDLVIPLERKSALLHGEDARAFGRQAFYRAGLARPAFPNNEDRNAHSYTPLQATGEGLARRFRIGANAMVERHAPLTELAVRVLAVVGGRVAKGLAVARLMMSLVRR